MGSLKKKPGVIPLAREAPLSVPALLNALPDAVVCAAADGTVLFSNHGAQEFFGMGEKKLSGKPLQDILGPASPVFEALRTGQGIRLRDVSVCGREAGSLSCLPADGGQFVIVISYETVPVKSGWAEKMKRSLKPAQHLARMLAHEIKNPLSGISGAAQLLARSDLRPDDRELAELIGSETQRVFRLIEKVNVFDDAPQSAYGPVNIHAVLNHVEQVARTGFAAGIEIVRRYDPSLPEIHGHHDLLVQAVLNLVKNAAEAVPESGGKITLCTWYDTAPAFHPESGQRLPVCMSIADNGAGISPDARQRLFEPYFTTKPAGEGLGLSIVSKIIDDHGGVVDAGSAPGQTVFRLSFPRSGKA